MGLRAAAETQSRRVSVPCGGLHRNGTRLRLVVAHSVCGEDAGVTPNFRRSARNRLRSGDRLTSFGRFVMRNARLRMSPRFSRERCATQSSAADSLRAVRERIVVRRCTSALLLHSVQINRWRRHRPATILPMPVQLAPSDFICSRVFPMLLMRKGCCPFSRRE